MQLKKEIIINQPIDKVWEVLGNQFGEAYKWASGINHSDGFGTPKLDDAPCNNRACELPSGKIKEVVRKFDAHNYELEYEVIEGFPFFVDSGINNWKLTPLGSNKTKVNMHLVIETKGVVGKVMSPMMKMQLKKQIAHIPNDLKHFVETNKPSENKAKELSKISKQAA